MGRELLEGRSWTWGLSLIALTIAVHTAGGVIVAFVGARIRIRAERRRLTPPLAISFVTIMVGATGLILAALHGLEALIWAAAYVWLGALGSILDALLYSIGTMTTRGTPGLNLPWRWQMMGALQSVNGVLLFGISTAFLFAMVQAYWPMLSGRR
jgi:hypothetical protein